MKLFGEVLLQYSLAIRMALSSTRQENEKNVILDEVFHRLEKRIMASPDDYKFCHMYIDVCFEKVAAQLEASK